MKNTFKIAMALFLSLLLAFSVIACGEGRPSGRDNATEAEEGEEIEPEGLWKNATYRSSRELGEGEKTVTVEVVVEEKMVVFTIHTNADTVGEALMEHQLIDGDPGEYGLYVKKVNGMVADYDVDKAYWAFYTNGEYGMTGVDGTEIDEDAVYTLEYAK